MIWYSQYTLNEHLNLWTPLCQTLELPAKKKKKNMHRYWLNDEGKQLND